MKIQMVILCIRHISAMIQPTNQLPRIQADSKPSSSWKLSDKLSVPESHLNDHSAFLYYSRNVFILGTWFAVGPKLR